MNFKKAIFTPILSVVITSLLCLFSCSQDRPDAQNNIPDPSESVNKPEESDTQTDNFSQLSMIRYNAYADDSLRMYMKNFVAFSSIAHLAGLYIHIKDSLEILRNEQDLKDPKDTSVFKPYESRAFDAIMQYKQIMSANPPLLTNTPKLLDLKRELESEDSSHLLLPRYSHSPSFAKLDFFFLGGAPFINEIKPEDKVVFKDKNGMPETRFECNLTENTNYLLNAMFQFPIDPVQVSFGPPLETYDMGPLEIRGIGSVKHEFSGNIHVDFLTTFGVVSGHIVSVTLKIADQNIGCVSDYPTVVFGCAKNINAKDILGIYIPLNGVSISFFKLSVHSKNVWTADLDNDGISDLACVSDTFSGLTSDMMAEVIWYINIKGVWKVIDWGTELDCT